MKNRDFVFFHGYDSVIWRGYEKCGLLDRFSGIRFCQSLMLPDCKKFNALAAKGGELYSLITETGLPWYIDRLQGGAYIEEYPYDMKTVDSLGNFYGFQMHEWMSNMRSDYDKLKNLDASDWNERAIKKEILRQFPFENIFLEAATAKEYAECFPVPSCFEQLLDNARKLFYMRMKFTSGRLLPCDSAMMAPNLEFKLGAQRIMPEIGAQTPGANIQLAYARGMSKAYKKSFGAYYEPWGGRPFSVCNYHANGENEWNIKGGDFPFESAGCNGGSSRSLHERILIYAYLSGAEFISEEWGVYNTFYDSKDFVLSPYGEVKRGFLRFVEKYRAGEFFAPVAIVLPEDMPVLPSRDCGEWLGETSYTDLQRQKKYTSACHGIDELMGASCSRYGNEKKTLINSDIPDAFDIIHADCESVFGEYKYLVDLSGDSAFAEKHQNAVSAEEAKRLIKEVMPIWVTGGVHWFIGKISDSWYLTVFNNDGIDKSVDGGEVQIKDARRVAVIDIKNHSSLTGLEGCRDITLTDGKYCVPIDAGDYFFAKIV